MTSPRTTLARAVALASGDKSVPPELLPRLRSVLHETRVGGGLYIRDVVNIALDGRADSHLSLRHASPAGVPPGLRHKRHARRLPGAAPVLPGPAPPAATQRALSRLSPGDVTSAWAAFYVTLIRI
jgi:hypothetical protein